MLSRISSAVRSAKVRSLYPWQISCNNSRWSGYNHGSRYRRLRPIGATLLAGVTGTAVAYMVTTKDGEGIKTNFLELLRQIPKRKPSWYARRTTLYVCQTVCGCRATYWLAAKLELLESAYDGRLLYSTERRAMHAAAIVQRE